MNFYDFEATSIDGDVVKMSEFKGKVIVVVNTASKCGFTSQYKGLEELYNKYGDDKFVVLGFPCDQFANQEPGDSKEIKAFCEFNYGVSFPIFEKIDVKGDNIHPIFEFLTSKKKSLFGSEIKWNFTKFLIDKEGNVIKRFAPSTTPEKMVADIERIII